MINKYRKIKLFKKEKITRFLDDDNSFNWFSHFSIYLNSGKYNDHYFFVSTSSEMGDYWSKQDILTSFIVYHNHKKRLHICTEFIFVPMGGYFPIWIRVKDLIGED